MSSTQEKKVPKKLCQKVKEKLYEQVGIFIH